MELIYAAYLALIHALLVELRTLITRQHPAGRVARSATLLSKLLRPHCFTVHKLFEIPPIYDGTPPKPAAGRIVESPGNVRPLLSFGIPHLKPAAGRLVESPNLRTHPKSIWDPSQTSRRPSCRASRLFETPPICLGFSRRPSCPQTI